jgi:hypothetical protein
MAKDSDSVSLFLRGLLMALGPRGWESDFMVERTCAHVTGVFPPWGQPTGDALLLLATAY